MGVFLSNCASTRPSCSQWRSEWQPMDSSLARLERRKGRGWPGGNGMQPLFRLSHARARRLCKCCSRRRNRCHSGLLSPFSFVLRPHPNPNNVSSRRYSAGYCLDPRERNSLQIPGSKQTERGRENEPLPSRRGCELKGKRSSPPQPSPPDPQVRCYRSRSSRVRT